MPIKRPKQPKTYIDWHNRVLERDLFTCQRCKKNHHQIKVETHHIKSYINYPELRLEVSNGMTLCENCHKKEKKERKWHVNE